MKIVNEVIDYALSLDQETFRKYTLGVIAGSAVIMVSMTYFIYSKSSQLAEEIENIKMLSRKISNTNKSYKKIQAKKDYLLSLLDREKNFDMKSFFESYYKNLGVNPEPNWTKISSPIASNNQLQEISLQAEFKGLSMQKITSMLDSINQNEMVYIKTIKASKPVDDNLISLELTIGALDRKLEK